MDTMPPLNTEAILILSLFALFAIAFIALVIFEIVYAVQRAAEDKAYAALVDACRIEYVKSPEGIRLADSFDKLAAAEANLVQAVRADTKARFPDAYYGHPEGTPIN